MEGLVRGIWIVLVKDNRYDMLNSSYHTRFVLPWRREHGYCVKYCRLLINYSGTQPPENPFLWCVPVAILQEDVYDSWFKLHRPPDLESIEWKYAATISYTKFYS